MEPEIRLLTAGDLPNAIGLWRGMPGIGVSEKSDSLLALQTFLERNPTSCFVLTEGQEIAGTVLAGYDGRRGYIYHLAVRPDLRGRGYGRKLLECAVEALCNLGAEKAHLFVMGANGEGISFYRRLRWTERRDITVFSKNL